MPSFALAGPGPARCGAPGGYRLKAGKPAIPSNSGKLPGLSTFDPSAGAVTILPVLPPVLHAANVVARALIPVFGILFLCWAGGQVLLLFFSPPPRAMFPPSTLASDATPPTSPR